MQQPMAPKPKRRKMGKYIRGNIDDEVAITSLASKDVIGGVFDETVVERTLCSSIVVNAALSGNTIVGGSGPLIVGVAHSDYTDAEIEEFLETTGQWDEGNMVAQEVSRRRIRRIGVLPNAEASENMFDGRFRKFKLNWILNAGDTLRLWIFNSGDVAVTGSGTPKVHLTGHANLWPR